VNDDVPVLHIYFLRETASDLIVAMERVKLLLRDVGPGETRILIHVPLPEGPNPGPDLPMELRRRADLAPGVMTI
jgi:hypothetical protein